MIVAAFLLAAVVTQPPPSGQTQTMGVQRPATPPRDATASDKKGTGVIRGRITNGEGRPLRRVQMRLSGEPVPDSRSASTNGLGQYEFRDLPAGRYSLGANRAGYLGMSFGQTRPSEPGRPIELADAQVMEKVDIVLPHTAIISGRVLDEAGEPLAGANVLTMQYKFFNGKRRLLPVRGNAITDDVGQYRLSGLEPGEYYVQGSSRETWETDPPDKQTLGFLPTMYPSAPGVGEAQRVRVRAGQETNGIDISLVPGKVAKISGTVVNSQGQPLAGETLNMSFEIRGEYFMSMSGGQSAKVNPDGTFLFRNIAPAEYHLNVRTPATADRPVEAANVIVSTLNGDVEGFTIVTSSAGVLNGRAVVEGDGALPVALTRLIVRPLPVDRDTAIGNTNTITQGTADNGRLREDGSFQLAGVVGNNRLGVSPMPEGWAVRRIEYNGRDYTTLPFDAQGQSIDGILIVLTNRFPTVTGSMKDEKGNPGATGTVILFPEDTQLWAEDARLVRATRPDQSGLFTMKAVRPGEYLAVALPTVQNNQWFDPEYLESLREQATRLTLREGERPQIELTIKAAPSPR
jgi:hypothetical protein